MSGHAVVTSKWHALCTRPWPYASTGKHQLSAVYEYPILEGRHMKRRLMCRRWILFQAHNSSGTAVCTLGVLCLVGDLVRSLAKFRTRCTTCARFAAVGCVFDHYGCPRSCRARQQYRAPGKKRFHCSKASSAYQDDNKFGQQQVVLKLVLQHTPLSLSKRKKAGLTKKAFRVGCPELLYSSNRWIYRQVL